MGRGARLIIETHSVMRNNIQMTEPDGGFLEPCLRLYRTFYVRKFYMYLKYS